MGEIKPFSPVKLICGLIAGNGGLFPEAEARLERLFGPIDARGPLVPFLGTDYYEPEMGSGLFRRFCSFADLVSPERLPDIKIQTNALEDALRKEAGPRGRTVNLDPGILTGSALFFATTKEFSHRPPLQKGIYAHLELLFGKTGARRLDWTYPDFRTEDHIPFFLSVRKSYLEAVRQTR
jgi:hypothetical protein